MYSSKKLWGYILGIALAITLGILTTALALKGGKIAYSYIFNLSGNLTAQAESAAPEEKLPEEIKERIGYFLKDYEKEPKSEAGAYLIGDLDTGEIILEKNSDKPMPIASVSKLMTALIASENYDLEELAKISGRAVATYGSAAGLRAGERIKLGTLLYPLLLESSNPVAEAIAEHGGRNNFLRQMNEKTYELGMKNTFYDDPSGLSSENVSTVADLFKLSRHIRETHPEIFEITRKPTETRGRTWYNNNKLIYQEKYLGGKSGYTDEARKTGIALFNVPITEEPEGRNIAIVTLKSEDRFKDTMALVGFAKSNLFYGLENKAESFVPIESRSDPSFKNWVDLAFVGDIMLDRAVRKSVEKNFHGDYSALFDSVQELARADISFGNLEGPVSDLGVDSKNLYSFRMDPETLPALSEAGFDALAIANNHIGDYGREAFEDTLKRLNEANILPVGAGMTKYEAEQPKIIEKNGLKIGFIGFSDVGPASLEAGENTSGILLANNPRFAEIIQNASRQVDALVVAMHWGEEYKEPTKRQRELAHTAIDAGAKIIAGTHPHVAQETEEYEGGLIIYSLGNFIFDQNFSKETMQGLLVELGIKKDGLFKIRKKLVKLDEKFKPSEVINLRN